MGASYVILIPWKQCYLIVPIVSKRTEHISAGALEIMLASYVAWSLESSANHSCHPFQYSLMDDHDHHLIITTQTNTSLLTLMYWPVWYQHPIWCRYADMQRCKYADMHQFPRIKGNTQRWSYRSIRIRLLPQCAPVAIARPSGNLTNLIMRVFNTVRNIVLFLFPPWGPQS